MAISKGKKQEILQKLETARNSAETLVFVKFTGLKGVDTTTMRRELRERGVGYVVAKKTLMERALSEGGYTGTFPELPGEVALAYSADQILPAQSIQEFQKKYKEGVSILGGVFAGAYKNKAEMTEIASIPALPVLRGMFVNVINSPIQGLVLALNAIAEKKSA